MKKKKNYDFYPVNSLLFRPCILSLYICIFLFVMVYYSLGKDAFISVCW